MKVDLSPEEERALVNMEMAQILYSKTEDYKKDRKAALFLYMSLSFVFGSVEMIFLVELINILTGTRDYNVLYVIAPLRAILGFGFVFDRFEVNAALNILRTYAYFGALPIAIITAIVNPQDVAFYLMFSVVVLSAVFAPILVRRSSLRMVKNGIIIRSKKHQIDFRCTYGAIIPMFNWHRTDFMTKQVFCPIIIMIDREYRKNKRR